MRTVFTDIALVDSRRVLDHLKGVNTLRLWPSASVNIGTLLQRLCSSDKVRQTVMGRVLALLFPNLREIVDVADRSVARGTTVDLLIHNVLLLSNSQ